MRAIPVFTRKRASATAPVAAWTRHPALLLACALLLLFTHRGALVPPETPDLTAATRLLAPTSNDGMLEEVTERYPPVALFVQTSANALPQLPRLLARIYHPKNLYIIHLDTDIDPAAGTAALRDAQLGESLPENVHVLPSETVNYRGVSMVLNTLSAMELALSLAQDTPWRYFINLSAADYPLTTPDTLRRLLAHPGPARPFLSRNDPSSAARMLRSRLQLFAVDDALAFSTVKAPVKPTAARNPLADRLQLKPAYAEAWMILPREFVSYATHAPAARRTLLAFGYSLSAPEHYFATLIANSDYNTKVVPHSMRHVLWSYRGKSAGQHPYYLDTLYDQELARDQDAAAHLARYPLLFARKFSRQNSALKEALDARAGDATHIAAVVKHFYQKLRMKPPPTA